MFGDASDKRPRDVVPIARALFHSMGGRQSFAAVVEDQSGQEAGILRVCALSSIDAVLGQNGLDHVPKALVDDCLMLSGIGVALVRDLAAIDSVLKHEIK